jgi:AAA15 family ATPase/GTPase
LLAIVNAPGGTVLIDEIENGLHHSVMLKVWQAIAETARRSETQIFATTHSWECIRAAHEAFTKSGTYDFRLHRLDRLDGKIKAITYDEEALAAAIKAELEVR